MTKTQAAADKSHICYGHQTIEFQIERLSRLENKVLIHVEPSGMVLVEAPPQSARSAIIDAVRKRARWIVRQQALIQDYKAYAIPRSYVSGETHFYLGRRYVLRVLASQEASVKMIRGHIVVATEQTDGQTVKKLLSAWYRKHARRYLQRRVLEVAEDIRWLTNIPPVRLLNMRKQWGSCSPAGTIILNPMLIKAPRDCIDYVILHEICHLKEHNHSSRFYNLLTRNMPNWKDIKGKLDSMAEMLLIE